MRLAFVAVLLSSAILPSAQARAAEIVQLINPSLYAPAQGFDSRLGVLDAVRADVNLTTYRQWFITTPSGSPPNQINWSVDSFFNIVAVGLPGLTNFPLTVPTKGSGSLMRSNGVFDVAATGTATFDLPAAPFNGVGAFTLAEFDPGLSDTTKGGTTIFTSFPATLFQTEGACLGGFQGSDLCGFGNVRLTYSFTPFATAVPEPTSWGMMLVGFAAIGWSLRHRARTRSFVIA